MGFKNFAKRNPSIVFGAPIVAAIFLASSHGGKNIPALDEAYTNTKDKICEVLDLDCAPEKKSEAPSPSN